MDFPTNGIAEPSLPEDRSSRHTLPVIVNEDTLRPPTPMIDEDHHPLTWWKETGVGERYITATTAVTLPVFEFSIAISLALILSGSKLVTLIGRVSEDM